MMKISLGTLDETWQQYNLFQAPLVFNDSQTDYKAIVRQDKIVSIVKEGYELLPNEEAVKIADSAAEMAGLIPFHELIQGRMVYSHGRPQDLRQGRNKSPRLIHFKSALRSQRRKNAPRRRSP